MNSAIFDHKGPICQCKQGPK